MDLPPLHSVITLARHCHMGRAAAELHVCTSTVSKHLRYLERALGCRLFTRPPLGMSPTPAGRLFLDAAIRCLAAHDALQSTVQRLQGRITGWIDLGLEGDAAAWRIPRVLETLRQRHPDLTARLHQRPSQQILADVRLGRYMAGWILGAQGILDLPSLRLPDLPLRICGPPNRSAWLSTASLEDLVGVPWIDRVPDSALSNHVQAVFPDRQRWPQIVCQVGAAEALDDVVRHLAAFCFVHEELAITGADQGLWSIWPGRVPPLSRHVILRPGPGDEILGEALIDAANEAWQRHHDRPPRA